MMMPTHPSQALLVTLLLVLSCSSTSTHGEGFEPLTEDDGAWVSVYPSYAYRDGGAWVVPLTYRVHEERGWLGRIVTRIAESWADPGPDEMDRLQVRLHDFVTDSESRESVTFVVEEDPTGESYRLEDPDGDPIRTGLNGMAEGKLTLSDETVREIQENGRDDDGWITLTAVSPGHQGEGRVQLVEDEGLSVISDIDDTVKRTEIPGGASRVVRKTFFEEWEPATEMAERFDAWESEAEGALKVHYVSAGPWPLQRHLADFLFSPEVGFPEGSFRMRIIRRHPLSLRTWRDLYGLVVDETGTYDYKVQETSRIVERFPDREFILVGDTGQDDPEAYRAVQERFPDRVLEIVMRDVTRDRERNPERLEGMTVIPAEDLTGGSP